MDSLNHYHQIISTILQPYTQIAYVNVNVCNLTVFDSENKQYAILSEGWDGTEDGIANELVTSGIPKDAIVLGFHEPSVRPHTGFAVM
jgi:hypothetical protein